MKGKPKFNYGDIVSFQLGDETKTGEVCIIDKYGTFEDPSDVSYDIMCHNDKHKASSFNSETNNWEVKEHIGDCLYKHISERYVERASD